MPSISHSPRYEPLSLTDSKGFEYTMRQYLRAESSMYLQDYIGNTPLVTLQHLGSPERGNRVLVKLEGNNPAGSVKDRPALHMIARAEERGDIRPGDTLIEATSGNTGIALAMAAAVKGYRMILIMPENMSLERRAVMKAYGAELILVSREESMMGARDLAERMAREGRGWLVDQFSNPDNPEAHYLATAPEIWSQSEQKITHFISAMGTTGTIVGCSRYFKEVNPKIEVIGVHPAEGATIPGIRRWPEDPPAARWPPPCACRRKWRTP